MAKPDVAALLPALIHNRISAKLELVVRPKQQAPWDSSSNDDATHEDLTGIRDFLTSAFHIFQAELNSLANIC
jgi:hypothetical protein